MAIVLASASPRRKQLLTQMGLQFTVVPAEVDETVSPQDTPKTTVWKLSAKKACAVAMKCDTQDIVIAADTIVVLGSKILGKPHSEADARRMLRMLSGRRHRVLTAFTVMRGQESHTRVDEAIVRFRELTNEEIDAYVATGEPMDKAGAYGVQGMGGHLIAAIHGDYYTVMGLPIGHLASMLQRFGIFVGGAC